MFRLPVALDFLNDVSNRTVVVAEDAPLRRASHVDVPEDTELVARLLDHATDFGSLLRVVQEALVLGTV